jgi:hypothetical protein
MTRLLLVDKDGKPVGVSKEAPVFVRDRQSQQALEELVELMAECRDYLRTIAGQHIEL